MRDEFVNPWIACITLGTWERLYQTIRGAFIVGVKVRRIMLFTMALGALLAVDVLSACSDHEHAATQPQQAAATYTCPMHPQVVQNAPGRCPKCGMQLVKKP
jgi:hypothetical protein